MASEIRFAEISKLLEENGYTLTRINGSHHVFTKPGAYPISIPVHGGKVKHGYLKRLKKILGL